MNGLFICLLTLLFINLSCSCENVKEEINPIDYVSTLVGTQSDFVLSNGNTYPAIAVPWGMNFWTPQTGKMGEGWAYTYQAKQIRGFKQTHQPSPWINDYGQFSLMPVTNFKGVDENIRASFFSHKSEVAKPHYYSVYLADHNVFAEMAPTERAAVFDFTFPKNNASAIIVDAFDRGSYIKVLPEKQCLIGYTTRNSGGVPENFKNWFVVQFDTPFSEIKLWNDGQELQKTLEKVGNHVMASLHFITRHNQKIQVRVASSFISEEQAMINLAELGNDDLQSVKSKAEKAWEDVLGRIQVSGGTDSQYRTFYSCLYRSTLFPRKFYEINKAGEVMHYSPYNGKVLSGYMYTDTGFWDTFRCLFPLLNLVYTSVNAEIQEGLANTYRESGFLPEWASPGHRDCMVGNNSASIVADAILKGVNTKDLEVLYEGVLHGTESVHPAISSTGRLGYEYYNKLGYVPCNINIKESVARTLEYAYNDWCILQIAKKMNRPAEEITLFEARCQNYKNVFDSSVNLMRGKNEDGSFHVPFSAYKWGDAFTEGNSWHYTWSVFHDVKGLMNLMGGRETFVQMLDSVFMVPPTYDDTYYGFRIHEILEMQVANMGNYAHGNQPAQHILYLYNYASEPWKTQYWVREVMDKLYTANPDGYCGDEDNGQTSAWYVFSAMGFYPVCPGTDEYIVGSPLFKYITLNLENGNQVIIDAENNSSENRYINNMIFNKKNYTKNYLKYSDLIKGATITLDMNDKPNKKRGITNVDMPYSFSK